MSKETASDIRATVESILKDAFEQMKLTKIERDNPVRGLDAQRSDYYQRTGKIRAYSEVLDAFAEAGFDIRGSGNA